MSCSIASRVKKNRSNNRTVADRRTAMLLMSPVIIYLTLTMVIPLLWALAYSFTDKMIGTKGSFVGFKNYIELIQDKTFIKAVINTLLFTSVSVFFKVFFGLILALILNENLKFRNVYRALLLLPWSIPNVITVLTWQWLLSDVGGVLNFILLKLGVVSSPIGWLATPRMAMFSVILVNVWKGTPFLALTILAGLQTIPSDLYESSAIDGANMFQRFLYVTLPSVINVISLGALVTTIWTINNFELVWLLTGGGPMDATQLITTLSYTIGFKNLYVGKAITISIIAFPFIVLLVHEATKKTLAED